MNNMEGVDNMKDFFAIFIGSLILCLIVIFFFGGLLFTNIWAVLVLISLISAIVIKAFISQDLRIDELEKKIEQLLNDKQNL